ncbi:MULTISPECIES: lipid A biosynthesis lauroyl acyltransferase [unclassified Helicobacter]|uniref:lipid A biosynthesis lauroyl acyltransferase n=1 Tax=unclassified Helicobacter TaxID=2593540 RepID=UPI000AE2E5E1|nr:MULTISPECIES: lipid A biosynthesis lauroyl acyltransferase [unclassified Helicobacter]
MQKAYMNFIGKLLGAFISALGAFLAAIPHGAFLFCVKTLGFLMCLLDNKRRYNDAMSNLNFIYKDRLTPKQKKAIIKRCYKNFAFVILESIRIPKIPYYIHKQRFEVIDEHYLLDSLKKDSGAIIISGHFGYWEAMATFLPPRLRPYHMASLGRLTGIDSIDKLIISRRELQGVKFINKSGAFRELLRFYAGKNALAGILVDQSISSNEGVQVEFMGKKATYTPIASILSRRFNVAIVPTFIDFNKDYSKFSVRFYPPIYTPHTDDTAADIALATQAQADIQTLVINENPSSWFWFHRRWKDFYGEIYAAKK